MPQRNRSQYVPNDESRAYEGAGGKVTHWGDYLDPIAVFNATGWPAPEWHRAPDNTLRVGLLNNEREGPGL